MASTGEQQHKWAEDGGVRDPKATCSSLGEMVAKFEGGGGDPANFLSQAVSAPHPRPTSCRHLPRARTACRSSTSRHRRGGSSSSSDAAASDPIKHAPGFLRRGTL